MFTKLVASSTLAMALTFGFAQNVDANIAKVDPTMKVTTGGFFKFIGGMVHNHHEHKDKDLISKYDADNNLVKNIPYKRRKGDFFMDAEVIVKADAITKDNVKYGAEVQLEANPGNSQKIDRPIAIKGIPGQKNYSGVIIGSPDNPGKAHLINADKVYMYVSKDDVGRIEAGSNDGVANELFYYAPASFGTGGFDGLYQDFLGSEVVDTPYIPKGSFRSLKVSYLTPRYEGFQAGVSFTPTNGRRGRLIKRNRVALTDPGFSKLSDENFENIVEYGLNYINTFDGVGLFLSATGAQGKALKFPGRKYDDLNSYGFGGQLVYAGYTLGGSWVNNNRSGYFKGTHKIARLSKGKERGWSIGLQYEAGPVIIGTNYANMRTADDTTICGKNKASVVSGGATYKVASGLSVFTEATGTHRKLKRSHERRDRDHRSVVLIGSKIDW
ncbi:MAG: porin [Alphaproteobacteria bacterium]|nr:porin [Alphaproteobacteria bacterium]